MWTNRRSDSGASFPVNGALVVSSRFAQDETALTQLSLEFSGEHGVTLSSPLLQNAFGDSAPH